MLEWRNHACVEWTPRKRTSPLLLSISSLCLRSWSLVSAKCRQQVFPTRKQWNRKIKSTETRKIRKSLKVSKSRQVTVCKNIRPSISASVSPFKCIVSCFTSSSVSGSPWSFRTWASSSTLTNKTKLKQKTQNFPLRPPPLCWSRRKATHGVWTRQGNPIVTFQLPWQQNPWTILLSSSPHTL